MNPKLFAFTVIGTRQRGSRLTISHITGYVFEPNELAAKDHAAAAWKSKFPRMKPIGMSVVEIPTELLPANRNFDALVPSHSIPGRQVRALIGWPLASEAA